MEYLNPRLNMLVPYPLFLELPLSGLKQAFPYLFFFALCLPAIGYYGYAIYTSITFFARRITVDSNFCPLVTVLKPVCGLDIDTYENFSSFCCQDYPKYQIIFSVQDAEDPVIEIVRRIIQNFPKIDIRLVVSNHTIGSNLKVSNLANAETLAKYEILVLADSDVRVRPDYLQRIVQPLQRQNVGAVTCLYRPVTRGWVANFEALGISTDYLSTVMVANQLGNIQFALGPTIALRRVALEKFGGFAAIADYLADDYQIGYLCVQVGYKVVLSDYVIDHIISTDSLADLFRRQVRWACCIRVSRFWGYVGLIFSHGIVSSLIFLCLTGGSLLGWIGFGVTWISRLTMAWIVGAVGLKDSAVKKFLWLVPFRDLISFILWLYSFRGNQINWRGRKMLLTKDGKLICQNVTELPNKGIPGILNKENAG